MQEMLYNQDGASFVPGPLGAPVPDAEVLPAIKEMYRRHAVSTPPALDQRGTDWGVACHPRARGCQDAIRNSYPTHFAQAVGPSGKGINSFFSSVVATSRGAGGAVPCLLRPKNDAEYATMAAEVRSWADGPLKLDPFLVEQSEAYSLRVYGAVGAAPAIIRCLTAAQQNWVDLYMPTRDMVLLFMVSGQSKGTSIHNKYASPADCKVSIFMILTNPDLEARVREHYEHTLHNGEQEPVVSSVLESAMSIAVCPLYKGALRHEHTKTPVVMAIRDSFAAAGVTVLRLMDQTAPRERVAVIATSVMCTILRITTDFELTILTKNELNERFKGVKFFDPDWYAVKTAILSARDLTKGDVDERMIDTVIERMLRDKIFRAIHPIVVATDSGALSKIAYAFYKGSTRFLAEDTSLIGRKLLRTSEYALPTEAQPNRADYAGTAKLAVAVVLVAAFNLPLSQHTYDKMNWFTLPHDGPTVDFVELAEAVGSLIRKNNTNIIDRVPPPGPSPFDLVESEIGEIKRNIYTGCQAKKYEERLAGLEAEHSQYKKPKEEKHRGRMASQSRAADNGGIRPLPTTSLTRILSPAVNASPARGVQSPTAKSASPALQTVSSKAASSAVSASGSGPALINAAAFAGRKK